MSQTFVYLSNGQFGSEVLDRLYANKSARLLAVVTTPDKQSGRGLRVKPGYVKQIAMSLDNLDNLDNVELIESEDASSSDLINRIAGIRPDFIIVCDFGQMVPMRYHDISKLGCYNIHPSLLPKYRGSSPISEPILNNDKETGVTYIKVSNKLDAGDIVCSAKCGIADSDNYETLKSKLVQLAGDLFETFTKIISADNQLFTIQDHSLATYTRKLDPSVLKLDWNDEYVYIHNKIRAFIKPGVYFTWKNKRFKILESAYEKFSSMERVGTIVVIDERGVGVQTVGGLVFLKKIQPESGKILSFKDFVNGFRLKIGDSFVNY